MLVPGPSPMPSRELRELLTELFSESELRRWVAEGPDPDISSELPGTGASMADLVHGLIGILERRRLIDKVFFDRLRCERPRRQSEISRVEARWMGSEPLTEMRAPRKTHVITLEARIRGSVSLIDDDDIRAALGSDEEISRLSLDLGSLDLSIGDEKTWLEGQTRIRSEVQGFLHGKVRRSGTGLVSIFGLAPIPWLMALGHAISETVPTRLFTRLRVPPSWRWEPDTPLLPRWKKARVGEAIGARCAAILVSGSAKVRHDRVDRVLPEGDRFTYTISLESPRIDAIRSEAQLDEFGELYRSVLDEIESDGPAVEVIHVFVAGPVAIAVECGRRILHSSSPPIVTYQLTPHGYVRALTLGG